MWLIASLSVQLNIHINPSPLVKSSSRCWQCQIPGVIHRHCVRAPDDDCINEVQCQSNMLVIMTNRSTGEKERNLVSILNESL